MQLISHIEPEAFSEAALHFINHTKPHHHHHQKRNPGKYDGSHINEIAYHRHHLRRRRLIYEDYDDTTNSNTINDPSISPVEALPGTEANISTVWSAGNTSFYNGSFQSFGNDTDDEFLDIANGFLADANNSLPMVANISSLTPLDIVDYYINLINCMQEYQLEDYTSAYKSCLREELTFIHIEGDHYYRVLPRYPYLHVNEYLQSIPNARLVQRSSSDLFDYIICACLVVFTGIGLVIAFYRLDMGNWLWHKTASIRKRRVSKAPPIEGGYSSLSSELPVYKVWGSGSSVQPSSETAAASKDIVATSALNPSEIELHSSSKPSAEDRGSHSSGTVTRSLSRSSLSEGSSRDQRLFHPKEGIYVPRVFGGFGGGAGMDDSALRKLSSLSEEDGQRSTRSYRSRYKEHLLHDNDQEAYVSIVNFQDDDVSESSALQDDLDVILQDHLPSSPNVVDLLHFESSDPSKDKEQAA
jgi:hypothetical protein